MHIKSIVKSDEDRRIRKNAFASGFIIPNQLFENKTEK